jgi:hypothetical protein
VHSVINGPVQFSQFGAHLATNTKKSLTPQDSRDGEALRFDVILIAADEFV